MAIDMILNAKVRHKRLFPKENKFVYRTFYVHLDMNKLSRQASSWIFGRNQKGLMSYKDIDHGYRDGRSALNWLKEILDSYHIEFDQVNLVTMPRIFGYVFNPVSFWFIHKNDMLTAVLVEVNNTFGESHSYLCIHPDNKEIDRSVWFRADKLFHVSPFMDRSGYYRFNFNYKEPHKTIAIHYYDDDKLKLITSIEGYETQLTNYGLIKSFFRAPLLTLKVSLLIHYQAVKIWFKKVKYRSKPVQIEKKLSVASMEITNN